MRRLIFAILLLSGLAAEVAQAQDESVAEAVRELYRNLQYDEAADLARDAIDRGEVYDADELAEIHVLLSLIHFVRQEPDQARDEFLLATSLAPDLTLDPVLFPPRAMAFFDEIRQSISESVVDRPSMSPRYIVLSDPRPAAALRSALLPGWGQRYKGHTDRGTAITVGFLASVAGAVIMADRAGEDSDAPFLRDADVWHYAFLASAVGFWTYGYLDALIAEVPLRNQSAVNLNARMTPAGPSLSARMTF